MNHPKHRVSEYSTSLNYFTRYLSTLDISRDTEDGTSKTVFYLSSTVHERFHSRPRSVRRLDLVFKFAAQICKRQQSSNKPGTANELQANNSFCCSTSSWPALHEIALNCHGQTVPRNVQQRVIQLTSCKTSDQTVRGQICAARFFEKLERASGEE